ncbi:MAG: hypothetical protein AB8H79_14620 [Myxococcota bacterium]
MNGSEDDPFAQARLDGAQRLAGGVAAWSVLGLILGGLGPGVSALFLGGGFAFFVIASEVVGVGGGVLMGVIDPPGRMVHEGLRGPELRAKLAAATVVSACAGVLWAGSAGAVGAFCLFPLGDLLAGRTITGDGIGLLCLLGAVMGALAGTPAVATFSLVRGIGVAYGRAWWHTIAGIGAAGVVTALLSLPVLFGVIAVID